MHSANNPLGNKGLHLVQHLLAGRGLSVLAINRWHQILLEPLKTPAANAVDALTALRDTPGALQDSKSLPYRLAVETLEALQAALKEAIPKITAQDSSPNLPDYLNMSPDKILMGDSPVIFDAISESPRAIKLGSKYSGNYIVGEEITARTGWQPAISHNYPMLDATKHLQHRDHFPK